MSLQVRLSPAADLGCAPWAGRLALLRSPAGTKSQKKQEESYKMAFAPYIVGLLSR